MKISKNARGEIYGFCTLVEVLRMSQISKREKEIIGSIAHLCKSTLVIGDRFLEYFEECKDIGYAVKISNGVQIGQLNTSNLDQEKVV